MPKVLNKHYDDCSQAVYVGRPSAWGNPFVVGVHGDREAVIKQYEIWLKQNKLLMSLLPRIRGKDLACWCAPRQCHADVLIRLANA